MYGQQGTTRSKPEAEELDDVVKLFRACCKAEPYMDVDAPPTAVSFIKVLTEIIRKSKSATMMGLEVDIKVLQKSLEESQYFVSIVSTSAR